MPRPGRRRMIGLLGGTFDPVHHGHLRPALEIRDRLGLDEVRFIPCGQPPHRSQPREPARVRALLVELAIQGEAGFIMDRRELERQGPSYTVETLESFRAELGEEAGLCWIMGADAFQGLPEWHRPEDLLRLAHIVVAHRPQEASPPPNAALDRLIRGRVCDSPAALAQAPAGRVTFVEVTSLAISATAIRALLAAGRSPRFLLPDRVWDEIRQQELYAWRETMRGNFE